MKFWILGFCVWFVLKTNWRQLPQVHRCTINTVHIHVPYWGYFETDALPVCTLGNIKLHTAKYTLIHPYPTLVSLHCFVIDWQIWSIFGRVYTCRGCVKKLGSIIFYERNPYWQIYQCLDPPWSRFATASVCCILQLIHV